LTVKGSLQHLPRELHDRRGMVAEKKSVCRSAGGASGRADVGQEAHVEHPVGLVEDEDLEASSFA
jgi:hypothetical protein